MSYLSFMLDHRITQKVVSSALPMLVNLGLIEIETGPRGGNVFRLSNRWRGIGEAEAKELAREVKPHRTFEKRPEASRERIANLATLKLPKPMTGERRRYRRRPPSLPTMPWQDDRLYSTSLATSMSCPRNASNLIPAVTCSARTRLSVSRMRASQNFVIGVVSVQSR
ncbi:MULTISPECIES: hypothetical protein [unclassified Bradyrhizobium]